MSCQGCDDPNNSEYQVRIFKAYQKMMWNKSITTIQVGMCSDCCEFGNWWGVRDRPGVILCPPCFDKFNQGLSNPKSPVEPLDKIQEDPPAQG